MIYVYRYEIAAVIITFAVMISLFRKKIISTKTVNTFSTVNFLVLLSSLVDIIAIFILKNPLKYPLWLNYSVNLLYQLSIHSIPITFFYLFYFMTEDNKLPSTKINVLLFTPYVLTLILDFTNIFTNLVFYIDELGNYHQGKLMAYMYIQTGIYILLVLGRIFINRKKFTIDNKITLYFYILATGFSVVFQWFNPEYMISGFVLSISILLTFLCLENPQEYIDKEMGIYNRIAFNTIMHSQISGDKKFRFLGIKIEEMKFLNETIGLENRIALLKGFTIFLRSVAGDKNLFRLSRSKMVIVLSNDEDKMNEQINIIREKCAESFNAGDVSISLSIFLDIVYCPEDAQSAEDVLDLIENSFNSIVISDKLEISRSNKSVLGKRKREHQIMMILEQAINNKEFEVVYQPIFSIKENKYTTAEALVRLKNSDIGLIKPEEFIPLAERNGMILRIGNFVFRSVCNFLKNTKIWEKGIEYIHINLSVVQCMQEKLYEQLFDILEEYGIDSRYINLEVTENSANASQEVLKNNMTKMMENNIKFSLDDYGTGFSNTASLIEYPFNMIKLDKTLIWDAMKDDKAKVILKQIVTMIKELGMLVIAEGVETKEQVDLVKKLGCDFIQGYYYSYPLTAKDFIIFMQ